MANTLDASQLTVLVTQVGEAVGTIGTKVQEFADRIKAADAATTQGQATINESVTGLQAISAAAEQIKAISADAVDPNTPPVDPNTVPQTLARLKGRK